jgi:hypothetical protein
MWSGVARKRWGVGFIVLDEPVVSWQCSLMPASNGALLWKSRALSTGKCAYVKRGSAKLVEEQQREIGRVSSMYKMYLTKAFGPWLITLLLFVQTGWQTLMLLSDYWLTYETSDSREGSLDPGNFIRVYTLLSLLCG